MLDSLVVKIIKGQMRYNRDLEVRRPVRLLFGEKVILFLLAFKYKNISLACQKLGYERSYFYFWFNRLRQANFDIKSLEQRFQNGFIRTKRPNSHPKKPPEDIVEKVILLRKQTNYGPERLHLLY